jgi:hypothetical protein
MSKPEDKPIEKASEVIERFGGIRPMAKKIDVAVTTIQGWKKRDVIPANRAADILKAAALHGVDLSGLITQAPPVNQNRQAASIPAPEESPAIKPDLDLEIPQSLEQPQPQDQDPPLVASYTPAQGATAAKIEIQPPPPRSRTANLEGAKVQNFSWLSAVLALVALGALVALFWPRPDTAALDEQKRLEALEQNVQEIKEKQSFFGTLIPEDLDQQIATLKQQAESAQQTIGQVAQKAEEISTDVLAQDAGTLEQRARKLQDHLAAIAQTPELQAMQARLESWGLDPAAQAQLNAATEALSTVIAGMGGAAASGAVATGDTLETALEAARTQNQALGETFEGVPQNDLKAAALLLGMTQFRSSLGRDNEAFADDLQVLMGLIGDENPELKTSLEKLAPHAEQGVLTPAGLAGEFRTLAGDAVVASLKGEEVSISERATARMHDVFQVEKDGQLISGTETQGRIDAAEKMLDQGNIAGAIAEVQALDGPAAAALAPWLTQAQATIMAQQTKTMIETLTGGLGGAVPMLGGAQRVHNEESGINVLKQNSLPQIIKMPNNDSP